MQEIVDLGDGKCQYRSWETIVGRGAWMVTLMMGGQLDNANRRYGEDLKRVVEARREKTKGNSKRRDGPDNPDSMKEFLKHRDISISMSHACSLIVHDLALHT